MKIPVSCALGPSEAQSQLGEWQDVLSTVVDHRERVLPSRLELSLLPGSDIGPLLSLAQRELMCCPFFSFSLRSGAERLALIVEVPQDAIEILDQLATDWS